MKYWPFIVKGRLLKNNIKKRHGKRLSFDAEVFWLGIVLVFKYENRWQIPRERLNSNFKGNKSRPTIRKTFNSCNSNTYNINKTNWWWFLPIKFYVLNKKFR